MIRPLPFLLAMFACTSALADQVGVSGGGIYVTRKDCMALVAHHPAADVTYQPGVDVHGRYVAPADLPGSQPADILPGKLRFDVQVNPLAHGSATQAAKYSNTTMSVARVEVDMKTGAATLNGRPLGDMQSRALLEACHKAGYR